MTGTIRALLRVVRPEDSLLAVNGDYNVSSNLAKPLLLSRREENDVYLRFRRATLDGC